MLSLLYNENSPCGSIGERTLYHLSLDRAFKYIYTNPDADGAEKEYFFKVLSEPLLKKMDIIYRQDIIKDFLKNPELLTGLNKYFSRLRELKKEHKSSRMEKLRVKSNSIFRDDVVVASNIMNISALNLKKSLILLKAISEFFQSFYISSEGLKKLSDSVLRICRPDEFAELVKTCTFFENFTIQGSINLALAFGETGQVSRCELIPRDSVFVTDVSLQRKKKWFSKKEEQPVYPAVDFNAHEDISVVTTIRSEALYKLSAYFESISEQIFQKYSGFCKELQFYITAVKYCRAVSAKGCPLTFPEISETGEDRINALRDLLLVLQTEPTAAEPGTAEKVVPNNFCIKPTDNGSVCFGKNGSGKTVFVRSVGTARLLAQAGLPVPAESAVIACYDLLLTQFSEAEKNLKSGIDAGRFEQEVSEIAEMLERVTGNAFVIFNETFQSTSYDEGAEGLAEILKYISSLNSKWVLVSHMHQIKEFLPDNTVFLTAGENFVIK